MIGNSGDAYADTCARLSAMRDAQQRMAQNTMMRAFQQVQSNQRLQLAIAQARAQSAAQQRLFDAMSRSSRHHHHPLHAMAHAAVKMWPFVKEVTPVVIDAMQQSRQHKQR